MDAACAGQRHRGHTRKPRPDRNCIFDWREFMRWSVSSCVCVRACVPNARTRTPDKTKTGRRRRRRASKQPTNGIPLQCLNVSSQTCSVWARSYHVPAQNESADKLRVNRVCCFFPRSTRSSAAPASASNVSLCAVAMSEHLRKGAGGKSSMDISQRLLGPPHFRHFEPHSHPSVGVLLGHTVDGTAEKTQAQVFGPLSLHRLRGRQRQRRKKPPVTAVDSKDTGGSGLV